MNITPADAFVIASLIGGLFTLSFLAAALDRWQISFKPGAFARWRALAMQTLRQRAAFVICAGLAVILLDYALAPQIGCDAYLLSLHKSRLPVLFGGLIALLGTYHWIVNAPGKI